LDADFQVPLEVRFDSLLSTLCYMAANSHVASATTAASSTLVC